MVPVWITLNMAVAQTIVIPYGVFRLCECPTDVAATRCLVLNPHIQGMKISPAPLSFH